MNVNVAVIFKARLRAVFEKIIIKNKMIIIIHCPNLKALKIVHYRITRNNHRYYQHQAEAFIFLFLYVYFCLSHKNRLLTTQHGVNYCLLSTALVK